jgi:hypothetical protein
LNPHSQNRPFNNNQHEKVETPLTTTTKQTQIYNPNQKQTLKNNQKKCLCTQDKPTTTKQKENLKKGKSFYLYHQVIPRAKHSEKRYPLVQMLAF